MPLTIRVSKDDASGTVRVFPAGSLDSVTAPALERELAPILGGPAKVLVLDLTEVSFVSSAGIRVVLAARKRMVERAGHVLMVNLQAPVAKAFDIIHALPDMTVFKNVDELDRYLAAMQRKVREGA